MASAMQGKFEELLEQDVADGKTGAPERLAAYKAAQTKVASMKDADIQSFLVFTKFHAAYHGYYYNESAGVA